MSAIRHYGNEAQYRPQATLVPYLGSALACFSVMPLAVHFMMHFQVIYIGAGVAGPQRGTWAAVQGAPWVPGTSPFMGHVVQGPCLAGHTQAVGDRSGQSAQPPWLRHFAGPGGLVMNFGVVVGTSFYRFIVCNHGGDELSKSGLLVWALHLLWAGGRRASCCALGSFTSSGSPSIVYTYCGEFQVRWEWGGSLVLGKLRSELRRSGGHLVLSLHSMQPRGR